MSFVVAFRRGLLVLGLAGIFLCSAASPAAADPIVRFDTALGIFDVELFGSTTPATVLNFLNYVNGGDYVDSFFHRLADGFVLQAGGFAFYPDQNGADQFWYVPADPPIPNEPWISNLRGTIAMAKQPNDPDSATSQFFFNLDDNSANLDNQNGGFTVFGQVLGNGMDVVDLLAAQPIWDASSIHPAFSDLPMIGYVSGDPIVRDNLEMINGIAIAVSGDATGDGLVDISDLGILAGNWQATVSGGAFDADFNYDQTVDISDLGILAGNYGSGSAVPEPATLSLMAIGVLGMAVRRRRR